MKRPLLAAGVLAATILVSACGSNDAETSSAAATSTTTTSSTSTTAAPPSTTTATTSVEEAEWVPTTTSTQPTDPYRFPGYRQTCEEALKMLAGFEELNKQWGSDAPELDQTVEMEKLLAEIEKEAEFTAMSKSEQDQFRKAFRAAATGRC